VALAAEPSTPTDRTSLARRDTFNQPIAQPLMIPFTMVVRHEFCDGPPEMAFTERHHPIETLFFDRPHEAFGVSIRVGRLDRRLHDADARVAEHAPHFPTPLPIAVTDHDATGMQHAIKAAVQERVARYSRFQLLTVSTWWRP
jgi:hypothetical protein